MRRGWAVSAAEKLVIMTIEDLRKLFVEVNAAQAKPDAEIITREQAAEILQVSPSIVTKYVRERGLPAHPLGPREWRFRRSELVQWVADQKVESR